MVVLGKSIFICVSLLTITVIMPVLVWHYLRHSTTGRTDLHLAGVARRCAVIGLEIVVDHTEKVRLIRLWLKGTHERQKRYYDKYHGEMEYEVGNYVYLKVSQLKGHERFGIKGKLATRFISPFRVKKRIGKVAYEIELPP
ncbi:hypothetical protein Sjap_013426 [Stephania japonica]|uniref:Tf2-1-like SH3-like domain-containing protein n=1 Tax=Stephania japonica TaxID=461633 RepID=A0AAP0IXZ5_9MAGN